jgi:predicted SnoaL-like aldol condensation-catalyzing enzyme
MTSPRFSSTLLLRSAAVVAGAVLLTGCAAGDPAASDRTPDSGASASAPSADSGGSTTDRSDTATETANEAVVIELLTAAFTDPDSAAAEAAVKESVAADAVAHGADASPGPEGLLAQFAAAGERVTGAQAVVKRTAADGDLVAVHYQITADPSDERTGEAAADVFRLQDGKVVERWTFGQPIAQGTPASGNTNTMFSDLHEPATPTSAPTEAEEQENRVFAVDAYNTLFRDQDVTILDRAFDPAYLQHNPVAPNGTEALESFFGGGASFPPIEATVSLADGDLVWTLSQAEGASTEDPYTALDIFRVDDGLIREHWDVVPPTAG